MDKLQTIKKKQILITGGSGFIGSRLIPVLLSQGNDVTVLTRSPDKTAVHFEHTVKTINQLDEIKDNDVFDAVINLAGQGITDKRWTQTIKNQLLDSRIITTNNLINYFKRARKKPDVFISGSAIGYYGIKHEIAINEQAEGDDSFSSQLCQQWEQSAQRAEKLGIRSCYLRTGIVLGKNGGALSKMLPAFRLGLGGPMGNGKQCMSWVHIDDLVGIILFAINDENINGPINGTSPNPVTNKVFSKILGKVLNRPSFITMPGFVLKVMLGQMADELLLSGQNVIPEKMLNAGYEFQYTDLEDALTNLL